MAHLAWMKFGQGNVRPNYALRVVKHEVTVQSIRMLALQEKKTSSEAR
jgi:hypothetical protein